MNLKVKTCQAETEQAHGGAVAVEGEEEGAAEAEVWAADLPRVLEEIAYAPTADTGKSISWELHAIP